jgi:tRNA-2-methylthio-N6-dimethylallyladenosine synthase
MKYFIKTYGCQMNAHESEKIAGILRKLGYAETPDIFESDVAVFNTCCIRENAENKALGNIGALKPAKEKNKSMIVAVTGCMTQADGRAEYIKKKYPYVDIILGTHNLMTLGAHIDALLKKRAENAESAVKSGRVSGAANTGIEIWDEYMPCAEDAPAFRAGGLNAFVNITYGCDNYCSYCIVPYVRGRERSRSAGEIIEETRGLILDGYKEITLLGQNVNSYAYGFSELLRTLAALPGEFRLKFMTSHPKDFDESVIRAVAECGKAAKFVHLPVQSGSTRILGAMNRRYTKEEYLEKIRMLRAAVPGVGLSSDVMTGFPGETEDDFLETLDLVEKAGFDNLYMFVFSARSGTRAADMPGQIPPEIKNDRIKRLVAFQRKLASQTARALVGSTHNALIECVPDGGFTAATDSGRLVYLDSANEKDAGGFKKVKIVGARSSKLSGTITN